MRAHLVMTYFRKFTIFMSIITTQNNHSHNIMTNYLQEKKVNAPLCLTFQYPPKKSGHHPCYNAHLQD